MIYGFGVVLAKGIGFFLLPVFTRIYSPAEYGTIEMLGVITSFVSALLVMGLDSAQSFYFFEQKARGRAEQARLISAILQWRLTWGMAIVIVATLATPLLEALFFNAHLGWGSFAAAFVGALFTQVMSQSVEVFRLLYRPWPYVLVTLAHSAGAGALVLILVLGFDQGIFGYFAGSMLASACVAGVGWWLARDYLDFTRLQRDWWPRLLRFGVPLVPAGLAMFVMNTCDRWFVQHYQGDEALGLYAVGAKFALVVALAIETFRKAWWPIAMDAMYSDDGPETYRTLARMFMGVGVAAVVYLSFVSPWLVVWLTAPAFHSAWPIVGVLAWQSLLYGFYLIASAGIWKVEKTSYSMYLMAAAATLNLALNWLLTPSYGGMGAALATVTSYLVWIAATLVLSEKLWPVGFPIFLLTAQVALGAVCVAWVTLAGADSWLVGPAVHAAVLLLLGSALDRRGWAALLRRGRLANV